MSSLRIKPEKREVIQDQLLTELNDKDKVAILATKKDLDLFIEAMKCLSSPESDRFLQDLQHLRAVAFK